MVTRIALLSDKLLEAGWLAALIVAPLFFNVYSSRVFEPDKISLIRSIALLMLVAWLVKRVEAGWPRGSLANGFRTARSENPILIPTLFMVVAYVIATVFSVAPGVSLMGGYQRLQGTYTTFSYIVIFLMAVGSLRTRAQFDRVINTVVVVSFPISFFGILQHFQLDPLPWGGDTTVRVAANMGNSIFVAAYLIMVVPITLARGIEALARATTGLPVRTRVIAVAATVIALAGLAGVWAFDFAFGVGLLLALYVLAALAVLAVRIRLSDAWLVLTYGIILVSQLLTILFSQSRGPELGLGVGLFAFMILSFLTVMRYMSRLWRAVVLFGTVGLAAAGIAFLLIFNLPSSPLAGLRSVPYIGRLGQILDRNSATAQVRELIWQGAVDLYLPHQPLWSPTTGEDPYNAIRPLVGYGPEAMYVAYNSFYPPELAHLEQRNASPDRSHNETLDSLVMTGLVGFAAYILLFMSLFHFGLQSLGAIRSPWQRFLFVVLWLGGGVTSAALFGSYYGWSWVGVALPFGMMAGFVVYLFIDAVVRYRSEDRTYDLRQALWISALVAALIGHFAEIHFGIAIVSTRTYFWFYAALLVILGTNRLDAKPAPVLAPASVTPPEPRESQPVGAAIRINVVADGGSADKTKAANGARAAEIRRRKRRRPETVRAAARKESEGSNRPLGSVLAWTAVTALIMVTLCFEFLNNQAGVTSALDAVGRSLFVKDGTQSFGVFLMLALTGFMAGLVGLGEEIRRERDSRNGWGTSVALFAIVVLTAAVWYALFQMRWLTQAGDLTNNFVNLLGLYYVAVFLLIGCAAAALAWDGALAGVVWLRGAANAALSPVLAVALVAVIYVTNFTGVSADILYKSGTNLDNSGAWDRSIAVYQRALTLQPAQDFYSLFLGRAYLESGRATQDVAQRAKLLAQAEQTLQTAQQLNPLNTDHSANLARLYRIWATLVTDPAQQAAFYQKSSDYYTVATRLSPNTAYLYNEWSQTYVQAGDLDNMRVVLERSLKIDPQYAQTYLYLGEYYRTTHDNDKATENYLKALSLDAGALSESDGTPAAGPMAVLARTQVVSQVIEAYLSAVKANPAALAPHYALADLFKRTGQTDLARQELEAIVKAAPTDAMARLALVNFYSESGQIDAAVTAMRTVMDLISKQSSDYQRFQDFNAQLQNLQKIIQNAAKSPNDVSAHRTLAAMWKARGQPQFALPEYEIVARLAANDYDANKNIVLIDLQLGRFDEAGRALTTTSALAPDSDKPVWQNVQMALNSFKAKQIDQAVKQAQAALALAAEVDKPALQAYVAALQGSSQ